MSTSDEEPYSTIFASLKHPIRRRILRMLSKQPMSFSEMIEVLGVSNSFLTYHLENLGELIGKIEDGKYRLSSFGEAAMSTMTKVEDIPTPLIQSPRTKPKRVIGRSVAIALGISCILLIAGLGGTIAYYMMAMDSKQSELNSANNTVSQLNVTISQQNAAISQLNATVTNLQNQIASANVWTLIDGNVYSIKPTPYGIFTVRYFQFLPDGRLSAMSSTCYLLYFHEPTPGDGQAEPSDTAQIPGPPPPWGDVMINRWLYSQIPTNLTEFTMPQSTIALWTKTANEPVPINAQVQQ